MQDLIHRIANFEAKIGLIGLGYVGLPLSLAFVDAGFDVRGFDIDEKRVQRLQARDSYVDDVSDADVAAGLNQGFTPMATADVVADCDVYIIAVPTRISDGEPAMDAVRKAAKTIVNQAGERETLVVVSSTVYPGATNEVITPIVTADRQPGSMLVAMVPERLNPGGDHDIREIPLVVGADEPTARDATQTLFETITETVPVDALETAEFSKALENTYRMVNIALVNQLVSVGERLNADVWEAIEAAGTKPFGFQPFEPGPGVGGHCIPIDPKFLTWRARTVGTELPFIEHAHEVNEEMPHRVVDGVRTALEARGVRLEDASVLVFGAAYKPNVGDPRNSPAISVFEKLQRHTEVTLIDPHVDPKEAQVPIVDNVSGEEIEASDAAILLVNHDTFDLERIGELADFIYDTKNAMPPEVPATVVNLGEATTSTGPVAESLIH